MKRQEEFDVQEAEKKRRFDSGEILPDIKDEYDFDTIPAPTISAGSDFENPFADPTDFVAEDQKASIGRVDFKSTRVYPFGRSSLVNRFTDPDKSGAEDQK